MSDKTIGEQRIRTDFNPSNNSDVDILEKKFAELINLVDEHKGKDPRLVATAQTKIEEAAMWAVKAVTA